MMEKKKYMQPSAMAVLVWTMQNLTAASGGVKSDKGIGYGGVDETGGKIPSSRRSYGMWTDDEDEEV